MFWKRHSHGSNPEAYNYDAYKWGPKDSTKTGSLPISTFGLDIKVTRQCKKSFEVKKTVIWLFLKNFVVSRIVRSKNQNHR